MGLWIRGRRHCVRAAHRDRRSSVRRQRRPALSTPCAPRPGVFSGSIRPTAQCDPPSWRSPLGRQHALLFGDMTGWFYALQAETGKLLWKVHIETHDSTRLTGAPVAYNGTVYVPVASWEETRASDPEYPCCTFRGSVVALRIRDGAQLWKTYMTTAPIRDRKERARNARNSGRPAWVSGPRRPWTPSAACSM